MITIRKATSDRDFKEGATLFKNYALELGFDLNFQNFDDELIQIQSQYSAPVGVLLIVYDSHNNPMGCVGNREIDSKVGELKRMYIAQAFRGIGIGKILLERCIGSAK